MDAVLDVNPNSVFPCELVGSHEFNPHDLHSVWDGLLELEIPSVLRGFIAERSED